MWTSISIRFAVVYIAFIALPLIAIGAWLTAELDAATSSEIARSAQRNRLLFQRAVEAEVARAGQSVELLAEELAGAEYLRASTSLLRPGRRSPIGRDVGIGSSRFRRLFPRLSRGLIVDVTSGEVLVSWAPYDEIPDDVEGEGARPAEDPPPRILDAQLDSWRARAAAGAPWVGPVDHGDALEFGAVLSPGPRASPIVVAVVTWREIGEAASIAVDGSSSFFLADLDLHRYYFHTDSTRIGRAVASDVTARHLDPALSFDRVRDLGVTLGVAEGIAPRRAALRARRRAILLVIGAGIIASGALLVTEARRLRTGIVLARDAVDLYAQGRVGHRVPLEGRDELGQLGTSLNEMAERLERAEREAAESKSFEVLRRTRRRFREEVSEVRAGLEDLARHLVATETPRVVLRGAGRVLARLTARLGALGEGILPEDSAPPPPATARPARNMTSVPAHDAPADLAVRDLAAHDLEATDLTVPGPAVSGPAAGPEALGPAADALTNDLPAIISTCLREQTEGRPDIRTQLVVPPALPATAVPDALLRRILTAIVDNAQRAMPEGGTLKIEAVAESDRVSLHVVDTGKGMSGGFLRRGLFRAFASGWPDETGLGLSLHLARRALDQFGGGIEVSSREGVGTRITLRLPLADAT